MKKYIPGTLALALAYLFLILAFTIGIKALVSLPVIVYAQYRLLRRAKKTATAEAVTVAKEVGGKIVKTRRNETRPQEEKGRYSIYCLAFFRKS